MDGYSYLRQIEAILNEIKSGRTAPKKTKQLSDLSGKFYTFIPHDFGRAKMSNFIIDTHDKLKSKMDLVSSLIDIKTAFEVAGHSKRWSGDKGSGRTMKKILEENPMDSDYNTLHCAMDPLDPSSKDYKMIATYI